MYKIRTVEELISMSERKYPELEDIFFNRSYLNLSAAERAEINDEFGALENQIDKLSKLLKSKYTPKPSQKQIIEAWRKEIKGLEDKAK